MRRHQPPPLLFGHPDCSRMESLLVVELPGEAPRAVPILREGSREDEEMVSSWFARGLGGATFRDDTLLQRLCRGAGLVMKDPRWILGPARRWASRRVAALGTTVPRLAAALALGRARLDSFTVTSHHFMSRGELATPLGRERLAACVFRVPVGDRMVSMCEVNALGHRERIHAGAGRRGGPVEPPKDRPGEAA